MLLPGLEMSYDFGYTDATYESLRIAGEGEQQDLDGNRQIFTPEYTSMLALEYDKKFGEAEKFGFFTRGEWKYLGRQYFDLENTLVQEPYDIFNGQIGLSYEDWRITFWGRNVFDTQYISYGFNFGAVRLGNPATYGVTVAVDF